MEKCILENLHIVDNAALPLKGEAFNACWVDKSRGRETTTQPNLNTGMRGEEGGSLIPGNQTYKPGVGGECGARVIK